MNCGLCSHSPGVKISGKVEYHIIILAAGRLFVVLLTPSIALLYTVAAYSVATL